jgi:hypothetical protein
MRENSSTAIWDLKNFPGETPPDPRTKGRPRLTRQGRERLTQERGGEGRGGEGQGKEGMRGEGRVRKG